MVTFVNPAFGTKLSHCFEVLMLQNLDLSLVRYIWYFNLNNSNHGMCIV